MCHRGVVHIALVNPKGGSGKSSTALMLAAALADYGRVALIDLDDQGSCIDFAGRVPFTIADAATWDATLARQAWDHLVVDGYARPTDQQLASLASRVDLLLIPTPPHADALRALARRLPAIRATGAQHAVVLVMVPPRPSREADRARRDLAAGNIPTLTATIPRAAAIPRAARVRRLPWEIPGGRHLALKIDEFAREVMTYAQT